MFAWFVQVSSASSAAPYKHAEKEKIKADIVIVNLQPEGPFDILYWSKIKRLQIR